MGSWHRAVGLLACVSVVGACSVDVDLSPTGGGPASGAVLVRPPSSTDAGTADAVPSTVQPAVAFVEPSPGATFPRDAVVAHRWVADVMASLRVNAVDSVELRAGDALLGTLGGEPWDTVIQLEAEGDVTLVAVGLDASGAPVARDEVAIHIGPPTDASCHAMLDALGLDWSAAGASPGIADPVRVQPIIEGVSFRYVESASPTAMLMDCSLAPRLVEVAELVRSYGMDEVIHIGIYNYRCIGGGDPDSGTCTPSQHAYATAIDFHAFRLAGTGAVYSTELDWIIRSDIGVCPGMPADEADRVLHEIACALWSERIFNIVLTPDYNADHRDHFHVDLTAGSMFVGETVSGIDPLLPGLGD